MDKIEVINIFAAVFEKSSLDPFLDLLSSLAKGQALSLDDRKEKRLGLSLVKFWGTTGTIDHIKSKGFEGESVVHGFDFSGRVKSLDRANFVRILADKNNPEHLEQLKKEFGSNVILSESEESQTKNLDPSSTIQDDRDVEPFDLVIVDLYAPDESIFPESMDIGGQTLIRAAIKNYQYVALAYDEQSIEQLVLELNKNAGMTSLEFRKEQAKKAALFIAQRTKLEAELFERI